MPLLFFPLLSSLLLSSPQFSFSSLFLSPPLISKYLLSFSYPLLSPPLLFFFSPLRSTWLPPLLACSLLPSPKCRESYIISLSLKIICLIFFLQGRFSCHCFLYVSVYHSLIWNNLSCNISTILPYFSLHCLFSPLFSSAPLFFPFH